MPVAFVLINVEVDAVNEVLEGLRSINCVEEAYAVQGVYDVVAKVEADTIGELKETVKWKIGRLDKVKSTLTMIIIGAH